MFAANSWIRASPGVPGRSHKRLEKQVFILLPAVQLPEDPPPTERWGPFTPQDELESG